ncbi:saccharopine dehydrogenase-like oxidoreductase [Sinocyclocheilus grahami]|uniref:saccharopine dehydrogenase-like oxidoreductase n=1 Tax=Sinocyclocheilus grahami TaxID=75366 RepID=UPI0007AC7606|nr:PREDICTED: saccharopine dehydrogenase-like oxidoreductase [Sinocyclocheilus grahami]
MAAFSTSSSRPYHIVIFGASGFTGQFVVEEVARTASEGPKGSLKWAVAGRNRAKLEKVVEQAAEALSASSLLQLSFLQVQYGAYVGIGGISNIFKLVFAGLMFFFLVKFSFGRNLLIKFPEFFSFSFFSKAGPTRKQMEGSSFRFIFLGEGYTEGSDPSEGKPNGKIRTLVKGPEVGYVATPIAMVQAALTMLNESDSLPNTGGVYTPGATFAKTTLIDRLNKHGIQFSVL